MLKRVPVTFLLLLLLLLLLCQLSLSHVFNKRRIKDQINCGVLGRDYSNFTEPDRVVNGQVVQENDIPWQVGTLFLHQYNRLV